MLKTLQEKSLKQQVPSVNHWNNAISDAEQMIERLSSLIVKLKCSIKSLKQMRDEGAVFPKRPRGRPSSRSF